MKRSKNFVGLGRFEVSEGRFEFYGFAFWPGGIRRKPHVSRPLPRFPNSHHRRHFHSALHSVTSSCIVRGVGNSMNRQRSTTCLYFSRTEFGLSKDRPRRNSSSSFFVIASFEWFAGRVITRPAYHIRLLFAYSTCSILFDLCARRCRFRQAPIGVNSGYNLPLNPAVV